MKSNLGKPRDEGLIDRQETQKRRHTKTNRVGLTLNSDDSVTIRVNRYNNNNPSSPALDYRLAYWMALRIGTWLTVQSASHEHQRAPHVDDLEDRRLGQDRPCSTVEAVRVRQLQKVTLYRETKEKRKRTEKHEKNESIDDRDDQTMGSEDVARHKGAHPPIKIHKACRRTK